ncbi:Hypothetical protein Trvi_ORF130 [Trabala vishnou gigantina nucleopolyhedrovirus]|uniref:Hypothetical protein n=1 Tax=Trabala vishnou gigantina nucleopolyhedrovirus TaxID=2863583 RepID=UPI002481A87E|nr:Hypothetical protein QKU87_gp130 [Trabala vishnou gigantina nucleopolyhedrovirus]QYC92699.1 Hypothetical protein Trvi_ORF130 [Trabala vishnou gigantina nucleopolyhedrovirus]
MVDRDFRRRELCSQNVVNIGGGVGKYNKNIDRFGLCFYEANKFTSLKIMMGVRLAGATLAIVLSTLVFCLQPKKDFLLYFSNWALIALVVMYVTGLFTTTTILIKTRTLFRLCNYNINDENNNNNGIDQVFYDKCRLIKFTKYEIDQETHDGDDERHNCNEESIRNIDNENDYDDHENDKKMPWWVHLQWICFNVAVSSNLLATFIYFLAIAVNDNNNSGGGSNGSDGKNIIIHANGNNVVNNYLSTIKTIVHLANSILAMSELLTCAVPVKLKNVYQPLAFVCSYGFFYWYLTKKFQVNIYKFIKDQKEMYLLGCICCVILVTFYLLIYIVNYIKFKCIK